VRIKRLSKTAKGPGLCCGAVVAEAVTPRCLPSDLRGRCRIRSLLYTLFRVVIGDWRVYRFQVLVVPTLHRLVCYEMSFA
jgi:hypothetical protein